MFLKIKSHILILSVACIVVACSGSKKYFKAAERLEKQGLVNEAAGYYLEALQRKPTNVEARIKLKEVGQKYVSALSSEFFREYNTQQTEASLETFEKLKDFNSKTNALNVELDYPKSYEEDYQKAVEQYCLKNYNQASLLVSQKKYYEAQPFIKKVEKYNTSYKNLKQLDIIATCEPLYQSAITNLENKNYSGALNLLSNIKVKTENYKDSRDLLELASAQQTKSFILFEPKPSTDRAEKAIEEYLYENFSQVASQKFSMVTIINNSPFQNAPSTTDLNSSMNVDLIQAIRKATGADYFYVFDVTNKRESNSGVSKTPQRGFEEIVTKKNDTLTITEYRPFDYNLVKSQRMFSYDFKYKLINAYTNQVISSQTHQVKAEDKIEYQEFIRKFNGNINSLYPYNPQQTAALMRYNPKSWRNQFSARNTLKSFEDLKKEALQQTVNLFANSASAMR